MWGNNAAWQCVDCNTLLGDRTGDGDREVTCEACTAEYLILRQGESLSRAEGVRRTSPGCALRPTHSEERDRGPDRAGQRPVTHMGDVLYRGLEINTVLARDDLMFQGDAEAYLAVGRKAVDAILGILAKHGPRDVRKVLDFGCGHGRVLRYLRGVFPEAEITAADRLDAGVDFCAQTLGAKPLYLEREIGKVEIDDRFDLVWAGSVATHLDWQEILAMLDYLAATLADHGLLIFSTHGQLAYEWLKKSELDYGLEEHRRIRCLQQYEEAGFAYADYPGMSDYGVSFTSEASARQLVEEAQLELLDLLVRGWGEGHHDLVVCRNRPPLQRA